MSIYLGQTPIGVSYFNQANLYEDNRTILQNTIYTPWERPQEWPDLDSLNLEMSGQNSFVYMTYRTGHVDDVFSFSFTGVSNSAATVELGTITNGIFTASSTETVSSGSTKTYWFTSNEGYSDGTIVIKITGRFSKFYLTDVTSGSITIKFQMQPMLERIWYMPDMTHFYNGSSTSTTGNATYTLQRDKFSNGAGTALTNMANAWAWCNSLQSLDISNLSTPNVTNTSYAFYCCRELEVLDISGLNMAKVTNMTYMFAHCCRLKMLDFSDWSTPKLTGTGFTYAFANCYALNEIKGLENIYTNNLTSLACVFQNCHSIKDLSGIKNWNVSNVTSLASLFYSCFALKTLDLSSWNIGKVTNIVTLFYYCRNLRHINFPVVQTGIITGSMASIFNGCYNLQEVSVSWIRPITSAVTNIGYLFSHCRSIKEINIPEGWNITGCTGTETCYRIFSDCYKLEKITGISNWDMSNYNQTLAYSFEYDMCLKELDIKNWRPHPTSMYYAFQDCHSLQSIDLTGWNWDKMTGTALQNTFASCFSLKEIKGIEHMGDSGNCTNFSNTFNSCYSLTSLPNISSWDPAKVTTCAAMFQNCYSLESLTITNWSLPKCTTIASMFRYCYNMRELELTGWTLSALTTNPDYIFAQMHHLQKCSGLPIKLNHRYSEDYSLPEDQWIRIFTQLPSVSSKTLYISTNNINRLSAETKAIATNKGWTLTN